MKISTCTASEVTVSWFSAIIMTCWSPFASCFEREPYYSSDKRPSMIVHNQPSFQPRPVAVTEAGYPGAEWKQRPPRKSFGSSRTGFNGRNRFWSDGSPRRPLISAPSDFRHLQSGSLQFPPDVPPSNCQPSPRQDQCHEDEFAGHESCFRPLELNIYTMDRHISPLLPHFEFPRITTPPPPPAYCAERSEDRLQLSLQRSYSSISFHVPRRHPVDSSLSVTPEELPPQIPAKSRYRVRAYTAPEVEAIKERVASALIEVDILQKQIDDVIERQSICVNSRPSTAHSIARAHDLEPMPSIPALPPAAPSFAERLNADVERPQTAPSKTSVNATLSHRKTTPEDNFRVTMKQNQAMCESQVLPPPLPLVLRPPLRKKKSFSRVSTWLFPGQDQGKTVGFDAVTNKPGPVKNKGGFYQIVSSDNTVGQRSCESIDSISTWQTRDEQHTTPSSRQSTPASKHEEHPEIARRGTFGKNDARIGKPPVGVVAW
ncbi:hypothetical protein J3458_004071 [Metarhizium acridum]|uniref:uncharacterized protein n=1 Tax=Metarhizium acridum TaxID=92637 RepID=UPI001C6ADD83|nr:hypothetical protein J3458_004071 [Metarhizium acridum]